MCDPRIWDPEWKDKIVEYIPWHKTAVEDMAGKEPGWYCICASGSGLRWWLGTDWAEWGYEGEAN